MNLLILSKNQALQFDEPTLGGKAWNMAWLSRNDFPVPEWWVVPTDAFRVQLNHCDAQNYITDQLRLLDSDPSPGNIDSVSENIKEILTKSSLAPEIREQIVEALKDEDANTLFAVRSSIVGEDAQGASFAGQMDSYLFQNGIEAICESTIKVMASAFNKRALIYRINKGQNITGITAAVIIQRMVEGDVSGVMFTANPLNGSRKEVLISGSYGCGEGIVSGICNTDEYTVPHTGEAVEVKIGDKDSALVFDRESGSGIHEIEITGEKRDATCMTNAQVLALRDTGVRIARLKQYPQDIEWAVVDEDVFILQTRPVTTLPGPRDSNDRLTVWDNSNIQESYCGVTTPLTFTYAARAYSKVYEQTMRIMGLPETLINEEQDTLDNLLGLIEGRVYYNINNWYRGLLFLPSFKTNKSDMERMMGLEDPVDFIEDSKSGVIDKLKKLPGLLRAYVRLMGRFKKIDLEVEDFRSNFKRIYDSVDRSLLHTYSFGELMETAARLDRELLSSWHTPIVNDFYVMMMNGKVFRHLEKAGLENIAVLQNNLLSGEEGIESTEPTKFLLRLCGKIRESEKLQKVFSETENEYMLDVLQKTDPGFHESCLEYIELYGDRVMGELKLESITLRQNPTFMFAVLKNFLKKPDLTLEKLAANEARFKEEAEDEAFSTVQKKFGPRKLDSLKKDLVKLRSAIKNRENMRLARTRSFGISRDLYLEMGRQLELHGHLLDSRDIFYITVEELKAYYDGRSIQTDFKSAVAARKAEFSEYEKSDPPHHFYTYGAPYIHNEYIYPHTVEVDIGDGTHLKGTGCYPGIVEKPIRLIFSPEDEMDLDGQILCTVRTDPGWAPLFPSAGGILVERGSTLSHSAVVARELGIPAIVGIPRITELLTDREIVRMDGTKGTIERLEHEEPDQEEGSEDVEQE